jgi:UDP-sulfoquinovose synthase
MATDLPQSAKKRILIAGIDGYLGWPTAQCLAAQGHVVGGIDNYLRRRWVREMGSISAIPVAPIEERLEGFHERVGQTLHFQEGDLRDCTFAETVIREFQPDAVIHLAQCPSAAFSMLDAEHAILVQTNNLATTFNLSFAVHQHAPDCHLVKVGSMSEYGTPDVSIPEGFFDVAYRDRQARLPFPRQADSWYGWSEVHSSDNLMFACRNWDLRVTNLMPGVIFGTRAGEAETDRRLKTRLDFDQAFGTILNRFCCQAVAGHPLTLFGGGRQKRTFLSLRDALQGLRLVIDTPPEPGEYRVLNHFSDTYSTAELALKVGDVARELKLDPEICYLENPRREAAEHFYDVQIQGLFELGYWPERDFESEIRVMLQDLIPCRDRIRSRQEVLIPDVRWDGSRQKAAPLPQKAMAASAS